jgi:hypothetical protein
MSEYKRIRLRRAPSGEWFSANPILGLGEPGYETDSKRLKIGDGLSAWSGLDYMKVHPSSISYPTISFSIYDGAEPRINLNLSSGEYLNVIGSGDTVVNYDAFKKTLVVNTQAGSSFLTAANIADRLGYVPQRSGNYSFSGHNHTISEINGLSGILEGKQASGNYAASGHIHTFSIGDGFSSRIDYTTNDRLNILGSGYTNVDYDNSSNTITISSVGNSGVVSFNNRTGLVNLSFVDVTGALSYTPQPVGNYALSGHGHPTSDIIGWNRFPFKTPPASFSEGATGEICWDSSYLYLCVATNLWRRIPHSSW